MESVLLGTGEGVGVDVDDIDVVDVDEYTNVVSSGSDEVALEVIGSVTVVVDDVDEVSSCES